MNFFELKWNGAECNVVPLDIDKARLMVSVAMAGDLTRSDMGLPVT